MSEPGLRRLEPISIVAVSTLLVVASLTASHTTVSAGSCGSIDGDGCGGDVMLTALKAALSPLKSLSLVGEGIGAGSVTSPVQVEEVGVEATAEAAAAAEWQGIVYDVIRTIRDPEKEGETLEDLDVVREDLVSILESSADGRPPSFVLVRVEFVPTVPHCSLATLIGLCIRTKLDRHLPPEGRFKVDVVVREGTHATAAEITKQINDKERVAAALENRNLCATVDKCIQDPE